MDANSVRNVISSQAFDDGFVNVILSHDQCRVKNANPKKWRDCNGRSFLSDTDIYSTLTVLRHR